VHKRSLDFALSILLLACSVLVLGIFVLGELFRRLPALLRRDHRHAVESPAAFALHSAGEFEFHRALEAYENLIDAQAAARQA
jgi:hypothetical protein